MIEFILFSPLVYLFFLGVRFTYYGILLIRGLLAGREPERSEGDQHSNQ